MSELAPSQKVITSASALITRRGNAPESLFFDLLEDGVTVASAPCVETDGQLLARFDKPVIIKAGARYELAVRHV
ncbi:hypothetical protein [Agrobacterium sp. MS2]|uniref:hypothetical protein n=1 Tax=Agrobacterium sp. MS2 TaxID=1345498 RepID=UPI0018789F3E|nr:hypothetical protein [Agrobacterium sp. MS2]